jgi:hypothetical protein
MGIGLSISRSILEAHDGTISHDADFKPGARFRLTLPLLKPPRLKTRVAKPQIQDERATDSVTTDPDRPASSPP